MKSVRTLLPGLKERFIVCYLLLTLIPTAVLYRVAYVYTAQSARREIVESQMERGYADQQYMQLVFQSIESKCDPFMENSTLSQIMDNSSQSNRSVMYDYVSEVSDLMSKARQGTAVDGIEIYTPNATAAEILPGFRLLSELNPEGFPESYAVNPSRALYQHFWVLTPREDFPELHYYAGLFDSNLYRINGVLAIDCSRVLRDMLLPWHGENESVRVYFDGAPVYDSDAESPFDAELAEWVAALSASDGVSVHLDESSNRLTHAISLPAQKLVVCRTYLVPLALRLPALFWLLMLALVAMSLLLMLLIFHPLHNITALARHMKSVRSIPLKPYPGRAHTREIVTIIHEYNALVQRVNEMSRVINKKELMLRTAQIERLQSQLNPHFFYGTLESIRMIAEVEGQAEIAEIAYDFSSLMRYSLSKDYFVPLPQELDVVRQYIAIQAKRIGNRFTVEWSSGVNAESWLCPKFVLFSMVENAFTHDVNQSRQIVHIRIFLRENADRLTLSVANDGPGIEPARLAQIRYMIAHPDERRSFASANNGRSIFNINDRLQFYYGEDYQFNIDCTPETGTVCSVTINRSARFPGEEDADAEYPAD